MYADDISLYIRKTIKSKEDVVITYGVSLNATIIWMHANKLKQNGDSCDTAKNLGIYF